MKKNVILLLLSMLVFCCNTVDYKTKIIDDESTLISKGNLYGNGSEGISKTNMLINDQASWSNLLAKMNTVNNASEGFSETNIDFSLYQVIAVFDKIRPSEGYSIGLNIVNNSENIIVNISYISSEENAADVMVQPFHIIKIPIFNLPIIFE